MRKNRIASSVCSTSTSALVIAATASAPRPRFCRTSITAKPHAPTSAITRSQNAMRWATGSEISTSLSVGAAGESRARNTAITTPATTKLWIAARTITKDSPGRTSPASSLSATVSAKKITGSSTSPKCTAANGTRRSAWSMRARPSSWRRGVRAVARPSAPAPSPPSGVSSSGGGGGGRVAASRARPRIGRRMANAVTATTASDSASTATSRSSAPTTMSRCSGVPVTLANQGPI